MLNTEAPRSKFGLPIALTLLFAFGCRQGEYLIPDEFLHESPFVVQSVQVESLTETTRVDGQVSFRANAQVHVNDHEYQFPNAYVAELIYIHPDTNRPVTAQSQLVNRPVFDGRRLNFAGQIPAAPHPGEYLLRFVVGPVVIDTDARTNVTR